MSSDIDAERFTSQVHFCLTPKSSLCVNETGGAAAKAGKGNRLEVLEAGSCKAQCVTQHLNMVSSSLVPSQISRLRINDTGTYQCLIKTKQGADYKEIHLSVKGDCPVCDRIRLWIFRQGQCAAHVPEGRVISRQL